tara:strand:+ start:721 stop:2097 length:1377 start_codon:yes stop_codon:yes gene_type:complete
LEGSLQSFKSFITEERQPYKVVILTVEHGDKSITAKKFEKQAKKMGFQTFLSNFKGVFISFENNGYRIQGKENSLDISSDDTIFFIRGTPVKDSHLDLISEIERIGFTCINSRSTISICADKYRSYVKLKDFNLTQPNTVLIPDDEEETIKNSLEKLDTKFPIILKTLRGSKGVGVLFIESERALTSIVQLLYKEDKDTDILIQEYIESKFDVRVLVLGNKILATMKRNVIEGDFRSNYSQGGEVEKYDLSEEEKRNCILAAKSVGGDFVAVDFIPHKGEQYFLEVNSSPGTDGIEEANNINIAKKVLEHYMETDNRYSVPTHVGYLEFINIQPFGEVIAKFDTGNGAESPTIHAENVNVKNNMVTWTYEGKTLKNKLIKISDVKVGGLRNYTEKRYTILLDIEFAGTTYKNVNVMLDDRSSRSPVLLNRTIMRKMNVMVDPQRKYVVTTKLKLEEGE